MVQISSLPIVQRELLVGSRKRLTFWVRVVAALVGFLFVFFILGLEPDAKSAGARGLHLFRGLGLTAFWCCLFGGALFTADCLSVEKREGTLGLLFLTDLRGYDVVLGKLTAKSISAVFGLLAIIPMLAVPLLLGGVTAGEFWRVVLALLNTMFLSLSIGMVASVFCRDPRNVYTVAEFLVFLLVVISHAAVLAAPPSWRFIAWLFSPMTAFAQAFNNRAGSPASFYFSLLTLNMVGWALLATCGARVKTSWQDQGKAESASGYFRKLLRGSATGRLALRNRLLPINPMLWIESRDRLLRSGLIALMAALAVGCWLLNNTHTFYWLDYGGALITVLLLHFILTLLIALDAAGRLREARRDGALATVLATRLDFGEVLHGEFLALKRQFGWPLLIVLAFDAVWLIEVASHQHDSRRSLVAAIILLSLMVALIANCAGLVWTGLRYGLHSQRPHNAALRAWAKIILVPLLFFGIALIGGATDVHFHTEMLIYALLNVMAAGLFGTAARTRLKEDLREVLTELPHRPEVDLNDDFALLK